jgi:hypothetical protein
MQRRFETPLWALWPLSYLSILYKVDLIVERQKWIMDNGLIVFLYHWKLSVPPAQV